MSVRKIYKRLENPAPWFIGVLVKNNSYLAMSKYSYLSKQFPYLKIRCLSEKLLRTITRLMSKMQALYFLGYCNDASKLTGLMNGDIEMWIVQKIQWGKRCWCFLAKITVTGLLSRMYVTVLMTANYYTFFGIAEIVSQQ